MPSNAGQQFSFIFCGGPSNASTLASRREVRSQAAKRCAEQRKATMAARYQSGKTGVSSTGRIARAASKKPEQRRTSLDSGESTSRSSSRRSSLASTPVVQHTEARSGPEAGTSIIVDRCIEQALLVLPDPIADYARQCLKPHALRPSPFSNSIIHMSTTLLAHPDAPAAANFSMLWLRQNMLEVINDALITHSYPVDSLAAAIAVAAGWESRFGDTPTREMHLHAFRDVVSGSYYKALSPEAGAVSDACSSTPSALTLSVSAGSPGSLSSAQSSPGPLPVGFTAPPTPVAQTPLVQLKSSAASIAAPLDPRCMVQSQSMLSGWPQV